MKKLRVNVVSESDSVPSQGVNTAFHEMVDGLRTRSDVKVLVNSREPADIIHIHTFGPKGLRALLSRKKFGKKAVTVHVVPESLIGSIKGAKYWLPAMRLYLRWFYGRADLVFAISREVENVLTKELKIPRTKIRLMYNSVDMKKYHLAAGERDKARKNLKIAKDAFVAIGIGQIQPRKRVDSFIATARELPDCQFIWIGGIPFKALGADSARMNNLTKNPPKNVRFTGIIDHAKVREYLAASDVFFLPSEQENHPMCVLEAAGANLPIVLRDIREYADTFAGDALMGDDQTFAKLIKSLTNPAAYREAQRGAREIAKHFDSRTAAAQLVEFYKSALETGEREV